jgi:hypothetical protein
MRIIEIIKNTNQFMNIHVASLTRRVASCLGLGLALLATSAWGTLVQWDLNPTSTNGAVGSSTNSYTVSGNTIIARGYDNNNGIGSAHELFFKSAGGDEIGLGLVNTLHNELQVDQSGNPLQFIQLDLTSILAKGFANGKIEVGSVQSGELFNLYGSNTLGSLGIKLNSSVYDSSKDNVFVSVPNFGAYKFISVAAAGADVLPVAFQADIIPVPETASLLPVLCLITVATLTELRRRRHRCAQL